MDPTEISSRRFLNLIYVNLKEGRDEEGILSLEKDLERLADIPHPYYSIFKSKKPRRHLVAVKEDGAEVVAPTGKWRAPPGWTPPGWSEERSFAAAQSFMGFQANPGAKK